ncbi:MAG: hypothetical protein RJA98_2569, partial [Pseudomonadota bacterium]
MSLARFFRARWDALAVGFLSSWLTPSAWPADEAIPLMSPDQPGSRVCYVNPVTGVIPSHSKAMVYFVRTTEGGGTQIIDKNGLTSNPDTGLPYGTDINNPGAGIVWWRHFAAVAPTKYSMDPGIRAGGNASEANPGAQTFVPGGRVGRPDCVMTARGTTIDLHADLVDYKTHAPGWTYTYQTCSMPGASYGRNVLASAGPASLLPTRWISRRGRNFFDRRLVGTMDNVLISEVFLDGSVSDPEVEWTASEKAASVRR